MYESAAVLQAITYEVNNQFIFRMNNQLPK